MQKSKINFRLLLIYAFYLNPIIIYKVQTICYLILYGSALIYILLYFNYICNSYFRRLPLKIAAPSLWVVLSLAMSFVVPVIHGTNDFTYVNVILAIFRKSIIITFLLLVTSRQYERETLVEQFMRYYSIASVLYIFSTILFALLPTAKRAWQNILQLSNSTLTLLESYGYVCRFGWAGFAGFRKTLDCTISIIFLIYLYASKESKIKLGTSSFVLQVLICLLGNAFYGRIGVFASTICLVIGLMLYRKIKPRTVLSLIGVGILGVIIINVLRSKIPSIDEWYEWFTTPFFNFFTTGTFNNYSADRLLNEMIFMPQGKTLLFGDGKYIEPTTGRYYMQTDSGFMRQTLFWGAGLTGFMYICWLHSLVIMKRDFTIKSMLLIVCILFEIKGEVYYELLPLFLIMATVDHKKEFSKYPLETSFL